MRKDNMRQIIVGLLALTMGAAALEASALAETFEGGIVRGEEAHPVSVSVNGAGNTVVDFGKHGCGWIEVDVERAGDYLFIWGELLNERGSVAPPKTLEWDLWLGTAAARPYAEGVYHPLLWRIWRDLGSGWLGDIGCHLMSSVWMGLGLNDLSPVDVVAETETNADPSVRDLVWPTATHIRWTMPAVAATGGKSIFFDWYDGCSEPDQLAPAWSRPPAEIEALFAKTPYGRRGHEGKAIRCRDGWILALHRSEKGIFVVRNDGTVASGPEVGPAPTHFHEFIDRCRDGRRAAADFAWSTHMMELILTGTIAERLPGRKLAWNRATQSFGDAAADAFLGSEYRSGWSL